jgi:hypothetical protein
VVTIVSDDRELRVGEIKSGAGICYMWCVLLDGKSQCPLTCDAPRSLRSGR